MITIKTTIPGGTFEVITDRGNETIRTFPLLVSYLEEHFNIPVNQRSNEFKYKNLIELLQQIHTMVELAD